MSCALSKDDRRRTYSPVGGHPSEHGLVALNNWIGHIGGLHRTVDRLTPVSTIPKPVVADMLSDGMAFGTIPPLVAAGTGQGGRGSSLAVKNLGKGSLRTR